MAGIVIFTLLFGSLVFMVILSAFAVDFGLAYSFARSKQRSQMNAYLFWAAVGLIPLLSVLSLGLLASVS